MNDLEKDLLIKQELQKDRLMSKKADNVINNFFKEEINLKEEFEIKKEQINKKTSKQILSMVASFLIIFFTVNGYAATRGYNNIFFVIKKMFTPTEEVITNKEEILSDRDITISYTNIEIEKGIYLQVNRLTIENSNAKLYMTIFENDEEKTDSNIHIEKYIVSDLDNNDYVLANQKANAVPRLKELAETVELNGMKESTNKISIELIGSLDSNLCTLNIDLKNKEIEIIKSGVIQEKMEKISEAELKEVLGIYATFNKGDFSSSDSTNTVERAMKYRRTYASIALVNRIDGKKSSIPEEKILQAYYEMTGKKLESVEELLDKNNSVITLKDGNVNYTEEMQESYIVISVKDLNYSNGIYTAKIVVIKPTVNDYLENKVEQADQYEMEIKFKLNKDYKYTKYCLLSENEMFEISKVLDEKTDLFTTEDKSLQDELAGTEQILDNSKFVGRWTSYRIFDKNNKEMALSSFYGSIIQAITPSIILHEDSTFSDDIIQDYENSKILTGTYIIIRKNEKNLIELNYKDGTSKLLEIADYKDDSSKTNTEQVIEYIDNSNDYYGKVKILLKRTADYNDNSVTNEIDSLKWKVNKLKGISIEIPEDWKIFNDTNSYEMETLLNAYGTILGKDKDGAIVDMHENVIVYKPVTLTINSFEDFYQYAMNESGNTFKETDIVSINGKNWYRVENWKYTSTYGTVDYYLKEQVKDNEYMIYRINIKNYEYEKHINIENYILNSIKITDIDANV